MGSSPTPGTSLTDDDVDSLKLRYLVELSKLGDGCAALEREVEAWLREHGVVFDGRTIPFVLMAHFLAPAQVERIREAVDVLCAVLDRFCDAYPQDDALAAELALPAREDALVRIDPGFPRPLRICRLDALVSGSALRFLEFNADSPAGIGYTDVLHEGLDAALPELPEVAADFETTYEPMLPELIDTLLDAYAHVRAAQPGLPERPTLALVDAPGSPSVPEFEIVCAAARARGLAAIHATLDELAYDGTTLTARGEAVQLVHRRVLIDALPREHTALVDAARDGRIALVNPFRARVANSKKLLALFADERWAHLSSPRERELIGRTVPWTRILRPGVVERGGWRIDLLPFVADNRERLVLKPASDYGGHGVALGMETDPEVWEEILREHADQGDFVVQEHVPVPQELFPTVQDGRLRLGLKRVNVNPFGIGARYAGSIARISDQAVINVSAGGGLLPSVVGRRRRRLAGNEEQEEKG